jgi:hypothetical protein
MNTIRKILIAVTIATIGLSCPLAATAGRLTDGEVAHLIFMRSEEKLARDVYLTLADMYPGLPVFYNIATLAEQTHTDVVRDTLLKFKKEDPEPNADDPSLTGEFENPYFADYFLGKFELLIGNADTALNALYVGAFIEELDMKDINYCNQVVYDVFGFPAPPPVYCGLTVTDVRALENRLGNLLAGSENHLCAFISQIGPRIDPECYEQQYLTQEEVLDIVEAQCSEFLDYVCPSER